MRLLLFLLLFAVDLRTARVLRSMDWTECGEMSCVVPAKCANEQNAPDELKVAVNFRKLSEHKERDCPFVMMIRPYSNKKWVVHARLMSKQPLPDKRITIVRGEDEVFVCSSDPDGSVRVVGDPELIFDIHADSYHTHTQLYCVFTMWRQDIAPLDSYMNSDVITVQYELPSGVKALKGTFSEWKSTDYVYCGDVFKSSLVPDQDSAVARVNAVRGQVTCPPGSAWKLMVEDELKLKQAKSFRCKYDKVMYKYEIIDVNGQENSINQPKAICVAPLGCSSCGEVRYQPCVHCAPTTYRRGSANGCASLRCADGSFPDKFFIGNKTMIGQATCGKKKDKKGFGWSITNSLGQRVEFDKASCVQEVSCHDTTRLAMNCEKDEQGCTKPIAVEFEVGEGLLCPDKFLMKWRENSTTPWNTTADVVCDSRRGKWYVKSNNGVKTYLAIDTTVLCHGIDEAPRRDPNLIYFAVTVLVAVSLSLIGVICYDCKTRKIEAELDKKVRQWSKTICAIKEPKTPDKSIEERKNFTTGDSKNVSSDFSKSSFTDSRRGKRKSGEKSKQRKNRYSRRRREPSSVVYLRPRELEEDDLWCKSEKVDRKEKWEKWIEKKGGIVREQAPPEIVAKRRAERHKSRKEERAREGSRQDKLVAADAATVAANPAKITEVGSPPDKKEDEKEMERKRAEFANRFITLDPPPASAVKEKKEERKAKKKSKSGEDAFTRAEKTKKKKYTDADSGLMSVIGAKKGVDPFQKAGNKRQYEATGSTLMAPDVKKTGPPTEAMPKTRRKLTENSEHKAVEISIAKDVQSAKQTESNVEVAFESTEGLGKTRPKKKKKRSGSSGTRPSTPQKTCGTPATPALTSPRKTPTPLKTPKKTPSADTKKRSKMWNCVESRGKRGKKSADVKGNRREDIDWRALRKEERTQPVSEECDPEQTARD